MCDVCLVRLCLLTVGGCVCSQANTQQLINHNYGCSRLIICKTICQLNDASSEQRGYNSRRFLATSSREGCRSDARITLGAEKRHGRPPEVTFNHERWCETVLTCSQDHGENVLANLQERIPTHCQTPGNLPN